MPLRCLGRDNMGSQETESRWEQLCSWDRTSVTGQPTATKERAPRSTSSAGGKMQPISRSRNLLEGYDLQTDAKGLVVVPIVASGRSRLGRGFRPGGRSNVSNGIGRNGMERIVIDSNASRLGKRWDSETYLLLVCRFWVVEGELRRCVVVVKRRSCQAHRRGPIVSRSLVSETVHIAAICARCCFGSVCANNSELEYGTVGAYV